jgi:hypothetical protein
MDLRIGSKTASLKARLASACWNCSATINVSQTPAFFAALSPPPELQLSFNLRPQDRKSATEHFDAVQSNSGLNNDGAAIPTCQSLVRRFHCQGTIHPIGLCPSSLSSKSSFETRFSRKFRSPTTRCDSLGLV